MQLTFDADVEAFRAEFVAFLREHLPSKASATAGPSHSTAHVPEWSRRWQRLQFDHGWLLPGQPPEFGGRNAGVLEQFVHREELARRRVYHTFNPQGVGIIAASLSVLKVLGSEAEQSAYGYILEATGADGLTAPALTAPFNAYSPG